MTPRESLNKILEDSLESGGITNPENITEPFAIGRWVLVEERLPKKSGPYMVQWSTKRESNPHEVWFDSEVYKDTGGWACINRYSTITHWLELDLPKQPNEKGDDE